MAPRKGRRAGPCPADHEDDSPVLHIATTDSDAPLRARCDILQLHSSVASDLLKVVADTTSPGKAPPVVWDLTKLVLEDQNHPVKAAVVESWLDLVYSRCSSVRVFRPPTSLGAARPLLLFADAVGSIPQVLDDLCRSLVAIPDPFLEVPCGEWKMKLRLQGAVYGVSSGALCEVEIPYPDPDRYRILLPTEDYATHRDTFPVVAAAAVEEWLYLACRLGLVPLVRLLRNFIKLNMVHERRLLFSELARMYTPRVMQSMPAELLYEAVVQTDMLDLPTGAVLGDSDIFKVKSFTPAATVSYAITAGDLASQTFKVKHDASQGGSVLMGRQGTVSLLVNVTLGGRPRSEVDAAVQQVVDNALRG